MNYELLEAASSQIDIITIQRPWADAAAAMETFFLRFHDASSEGEYRSKTTSSRLERKGLTRLDVRAFAATFVLTIAAPLRMLSAGHPQYTLFPIFLSAYCIACMLFYAYNGRNETILRVQHSLRIPLQAVAHFFFSTLVTITLGLRNMSAASTCSILWEGGVALEALIGLLLYQALYPVIAALPFKIAFPTMVWSTVTVLLANDTQCDFSQWSCPRPAAQYESVNRIGSKLLGKLFPFEMPSHHNVTPIVACFNVVSFLKVAICLIFAAYTTYVSELSSRFGYAVSARKYELAHKIKWLMSPSWQYMALELMLAAGICWHTCVLGAEVWEMSVGLPDP